jgi:hypothetical protein
MFTYALQKIYIVYIYIYQLQLSLSLSKSYKKVYYPISVTHLAAQIGIHKNFVDRLENRLGSVEANIQENFLHYHTVTKL